MWENIDILYLLQPNKEETIWCHNQVTIQQNFSQKRNEKDSNNLFTITNITSNFTTVMYWFWYDYIKPKYGENAKICDMDTGSFITCIKTDHIYKDNTGDVGTIFNTSNYEIEIIT